MKPKLIAIRETGRSKQGEIRTSYEEVKRLLGKANVTDLDDAEKVKASWGFKDKKGRKLFVWCYKYSRPKDCFFWSCDGDPTLLEEVFGDAYHNHIP